MILWYLLVGHVVGLPGTEHPQASGTWWYVDDSPHLADLYPRLQSPLPLVYGYRCSEQARLLKTVKDHCCDCKSSLVQTVGGTQACQPHVLVIHRYRLGQEPVGSQYYKILREVACSAQCTVGPI